MLVCRDETEAKARMGFQRIHTGGVGYVSTGRVHQAGKSQLLPAWLCKQLCFLPVNVERRVPQAAQVVISPLHVVIDSLWEVFSRC